ncbi:MAG: 5'/3'-nucleotidase SurE [Acidimicrobiia bacterium]
MSRRAVTVAVTVVVLVAVVAGCSGSTSSGTSPTTAAPTPLRVLVTNDDGFAAPGIDVVATALAALPGVRVTVVAPAQNQSGTGGSTTPGALTATPEKTASGMTATAVQGYPADAVRYALDTMRLKPDVVVSGINAGQNVGSLTQVSGTVGAAKAAAARGIPAIAASQGLGATLRYDVGARLVRRWIVVHRAAFAGGTATVGVVNLNVPSCPHGKLRGVRQVPMAGSADGAGSPVACASTLTTVDNDIDAFHNDFAAVTQLDATGTAASPTTTFPAR